MKAPQGIRKNHLNQGPHRSMAAQHEKTTLPDPEDISGDGGPDAPDGLLKNHRNAGGGGTHGMGATHNLTRIHDAHELPTDFMDKE